MKTRATLKYFENDCRLQKLFYRLILNTLDISFLATAKAKDLKDLTHLTLYRIDIADYKLA